MNNNHLYSGLLIVSFLCACTLGSTAQQIDTVKAEVVLDLPAEQVEVVKQFEARLEDAKKINIAPEAPKQRSLEQFNYNVNTRPIELLYLDPVITPIAMKADQKPVKKNAFIKAGIGNFNAINAALGYDYLTRQETAFSFTADYLKMNNQKELHQQNQNLNLGLQINHNVNELLSLGSDINYSKNDIYFLPSENLINLEDSSLLKRSINNFEFSIEAYNAEKNVFEVDYKVGLHYQNVTLTDENLVENDFIADLNLVKAVNNHLKFHLSTIADISAIIDTGTLYYNNYFVRPSLSWTNERINVFAGVNFAFSNGGNYILPNVNVNFSPVDYSLIPYIYWKGELQKNNINNLFSTNPYLNTSVVQSLENSVVNHYGIGVKGIVNMLNYDVQVGYGRTENLILFSSAPTTSIRQQFDLLKDTANILEVKAGLAYDLNESFTLLTDITYRNYDLSINEKAWHLPRYQVDLQAKYFLLSRKLEINPKLFLREGVFVITDENQSEQLNPLIDFSFNTEYKLNENLVFFGTVNNILASEYQIWHNYTYYGVNALLGVKAVF